jgi:sulfatase-like protein
MHVENLTTDDRGAWHLGDRARCGLTLLAVPVLAGLVLRVVLYASFHEGAPVWSSLAACLGLGLVRDALVASIVLAPLLFALAALRSAWLARPRVRFALFASISSLVVLEGLVEFFFFEEFDARFNNIAVDYVLFPGEVAGNLWQSYSVPLHVAASVAAGCALALLARRFLAGVRFEPLSLRARARGAAGVLGASTLAVAGLWLLPRGLGADRVSDEIAACGLVELVRAFWSADLEFPLYYRTLPEPEAHARAARFLGFPPAAADGEFRLQKRGTSGSSTAAPRQIVVVLEESLGSDFVGALPGAKTDCTPELERHLADGLLLSNLIANGNRTVRGLEGVLCSFVPLPGYAILSRGKSENVATVARVLRAVGYDTAFFYGGRGTFDHMESFLGGNGWDELVTEADYAEDAFRTAWGVADEYVFDALLARQEKARALGEPLFATMLSVSNHKPYDFPRDRYALEPGLHGRPGAVRYADACIGGYLDALHERGLDADTLVLIVGDHGARVYGAEDIPTQSYRIPALFVTPDARWHGRRIERLCSQVDLVPTLLDLAGIECRAPFLGTSVLGQPVDGGRAFVQHNRDVGILADRALVVLGLQKTLVTYTRSGRESHAFTLVPEAERTPELRALADDASAVFQSAYELYEARRFRLPEAGARPASVDLADLGR